jgi:hypothetical protein
MSNPRLLRRKAASKYLDDVHGIPCAPSTLAKLACIGGGPVFRRAGRIPLYSTDHLDDYAASRLSGPMRSTSDVTSSSNRTVGQVEQSDLGGEGLRREYQRAPPTRYPCVLEGG